MKPIFLIGFMGSGKSTLGKQLAATLNCPFLDSDREIEMQLKTTVSQIFAEKGEGFFRTLEKSFVEKVSQEQLQIIAVGGGLPCFNDMMDVLLSKGIVVYLKTSETTLFERLVNAMEERPLIEGMNEAQLKDYIHAKLKEREEVYSRSHLVIEEEDQTAERIIQLILPLQKN